MSFPCISVAISRLKNPICLTILHIDGGRIVGIIPFLCTMCNADIISQIHNEFKPCIYSYKTNKSIFNKPLKNDNPKVKYCFSDKILFHLFRVLQKYFTISVGFICFCYSVRISDP